MVVSEGTPVPPAQVAADASGSQRPRSRPAGTAAGTRTAWQPSVHPRRESCTGLGATAATSTVRAAPTAACAEHGMRLLGIPDRPGEPARTAVSRLGEKRVAAEEAAAVQVDATGPAQFPRGAEQVADAAVGADAAARLRRRKQHVRRCSPLSSATDRCLKTITCHAGPFGPFVVPAPLADRDAVRIVLQVSGEVLQDWPPTRDSSTSPGWSPTPTSGGGCRTSYLRVSGREPVPTTAAASSLPATSPAAPSSAPAVSATAA